MGNADVYFQQGLQHRQQGEWQQAINYYQKAIAIQPNQAIYYCQLAEAQLALQDTLNAITNLEIALKLTEHSSITAYAQFLLGNAYRAHGWMELALSAYEQALELDPAGFTVDAHIFLGDIYRDRYQYDRALSAYQRALQVSEDNPVIYSRMIQNYILQNDLLNASYLIEQITKTNLELLNPQDIVDVGIKYLEIEELDRAEHYFHQAITRQPSYAPAHYYLGRCFEAKQQFRDAIFSYREAIDYDPQLASAYERLGHLLYQFQQIAEAEACLEAARALKPSTT